MRKKRILSLLLSLVLIGSLLPLPAAAEEDTDSPEAEAVFSEAFESDSVSQEVTDSAESIDAADEISAEGSPFGDAEAEPAEITEPAAETEPLEPLDSEAVTAEEEAIFDDREPAEETSEAQIIFSESEPEEIFSDVDLPDNDTLFSDYVGRLFGIGNDALLFSDDRAGSGLEGVDKAVYDYLKDEITRIAAGENTYAVVHVPTSMVLDGKMVYTAEELGLDTVTGSKDEIKIPFQDFKNDLQQIINALLADCPYEFYWYDKTAGVSMNYPGSCMVYDTDGDGKPELCFEAGTNEDGSPESYLTFFFNVSVDYADVGKQASNGKYYYTDSEKVTAAHTAVSNADSILAQAADLCDYDKLYSYKESICSLAEYSRDAADGGADYGDPWQLISVFDGNEDTKAVCEGYAKAFQYLCEKTAFESDEVYSILCIGKLNGGTHMWNLVHMEDGKNYLVDVTNCDSGMSGAPSQLFLRGSASGSVSAGYTLTVTGSDTTSLRYIYNDETLGDYAEAYLALASANYKAPAHEHVYTLQVVTAPTCIEQGYTTFTCFRNDSTYKGDYTDALGHDYEITRHDPTLTRQGWTDYVCRRCGESYQGDFIPAQVAEAPVDLQAECGADGVILRWEPVSYTLAADDGSEGSTYYVTSYNVYRKLSSTAVWGEPIAVIGPEAMADSENLYTFTDDAALKSGAKYRYSVRPNYEEGQEHTLAAKEGREIKYVAAPVLSTIENTTSGVLLKWNGVSGASKYRVLRRAADEDDWTLLTEKCTAKSYTDKTALSGTAYRYTVQAYAGGWGCYSENGLGITYLSTPVLQSLENTDDGLTLTWQTVPGAVKYAILLKNGSKWQPDLYYELLNAVDADTQTYTDVQAAAGKQYTYSVLAIGADDTKQSGYSSSGKTLKRVEAPGRTDVASSFGFITVSWQKSDGASKYSVWRRTAEDAGSWVCIASVSSLSYKDKKAAAGTMYVYAVTGVNGSSQSAMSPESLEVLHLAKPILSVSNALAEDGQPCLQLSWSKTEGALRMRIERKGPGKSDYETLAADLDLSTSTYYNDTDIQFGQKYSYRISVSNNINVANNGISSAEVTMMALQQPELLDLSTNAAGNKVTITWKPVTDPAAVTATKAYRIYRRLPGESWKKLAQVKTSVSSYSDGSGKNGVLYEYAVCAVNGSYISAPQSDALQGMRLAAPSLVSLSNTLDENGVSGLTLRWKASAGARSYRILQKNADKSWSVIGEVSSDSLSYTDTGLSSGTAYTLSVQAVYDESCCSTYNSSGKKCVFVPTPTGLNLANTVSGISLSWQQVDNASGYIVYRKAGSAKSWSKLKTLKGTDSVCFTDSSVRAGIEYAYTVRAYYGSTNSDYDTNGVKLNWQLPRQ